jgi:hypothetical protein
MTVMRSVSWSVLLKSRRSDDRHYLNHCLNLSLSLGSVLDARLGDELALG